jgi:predicted nucleic acid-binding protein
MGAVKEQPHLCSIAIEYNLRGYDATHLACALIWQETLGMPVTLLSYDAALIEVVRKARMGYLPS